MPTIDHLEAKIKSILTLGRHLLVKGEVRATQQSLAAYLGIDVRKLSLMIHGRLDKGMAAGHVPDHILDKLAGLLAAVIGGDCDSGNAKRLLEGDLLTFQFPVGQGPRADLFTTLGGASDKMTVTIRRRKKTTLRAVRAAEVVPEDALEVASNQHVQFRIEATPGRKLIVLCREPQDLWRLIAPGHLHDGKVEATSTVLPNGKVKWLPFDEPLGVHHFVFIEYDAALDPLLPAHLPGSRILLSNQVADLAGKLASPAVARRWRWAEKVINAIEGPGRGATKR